MYKVWKFITPHIITEHTAEPTALCAPLVFLSHLVPSLFHSSSVADESLRSVVFVTHLKLLNVSRFGLSGWISVWDCRRHVVVHESKQPHSPECCSFLTGSPRSMTIVARGGRSTPWTGHQESHTLESPIKWMGMFLDRGRQQEKKKTCRKSTHGGGNVQEIFHSTHCSITHKRVSVWTCRTKRQENTTQKIPPSSGLKVCED